MKEWTKKRFLSVMWLVLLCVATVFVMGNAGVQAAPKTKKISGITYKMMPG